MTNAKSDGYHAVYFDDVASAVDYCQALVAHIIPHGGAQPLPEQRAIVWFHVPPRATSSTQAGCYLFVSAGALAAAQRVGLDTPLCGSIARAALPASAVLLFGEDAPDPAARARAQRHPAVRASTPYPRTAPRSADIGA
jgi:hypothetical protein